MLERDLFWSEYIRKNHSWYGNSYFTSFVLDFEKVIWLVRLMKMENGVKGFNEKKDFEKIFKNGEKDLEGLKMG